MPRREPLKHVNLRVGRILFLFHVIILMPFNFFGSYSMIFRQGNISELSHILKLKFELGASSA